MGFQTPSVIAGGKGTVKPHRGKRGKGLKNKRRIKSPKAKRAKELKRQMRFEKKREGYGR